MICETGEKDMVPKEVCRNAVCRFLIGVCGIFVLVFVPVILSSCTGVKKEKIVSKEISVAKEEQAVDPYMGDWQGRWRTNDASDSGSLVAQVLALGKGIYRVKLLEEFDQRIPPIAVFEGQLKDGRLSFSGNTNYQNFDLEIQATIETGKFTGTFKGKDAGGQQVSGTFELEKTVRLSPSLEAKPPRGAIVLFDGKNFNQWERIGGEAGKKEVRWKLLPGGAMEVAPGSGSIVTKKKFKDFELHLEFRTPFMPDARGQGRGNSGVYLQNRYEIQVLDSYGLEGLDNECGGIYTVAAPLVNMCAPPMQWQTYDVTFRAPRFDSAGNKTKDAYVTVAHNGVTIISQKQIPGPTGGALDSNVNQPGGIYLQDHGNRVQYRNIWLVEQNGG